MRIVAPALLLLLATTPAFAQNDAEVVAARAQIQAERTKLVAANLPLTEEEGAKFWPLYNEFRGEAGKLSDRWVALLKDYAANYDSMTDEKAKDLLKQQLKLEQDRVKLRSSYLDKFGKVLPPKKLARYYQIENKLDTAVLYEAAKSIPLVQ